MKILLLLLLAIAMTKKQTVVTNSQGTFRKIRERGAENEHGAYDVELWSKDGVPASQTVYTPSLQSTPDNPFFVPLAGLQDAAPSIQLPPGWERDNIA